MASAKQSFGALDPTCQTSIREKQRAKAARKQAAKQKAKEESAKQRGGADINFANLGLDAFPSLISQDEYFNACPAGPRRG